MTNTPHATAGPTKRDATEPFSAMAQNGSAQAKEVFEKMSAATADAAALDQEDLRYSTAIKGGQDYNNKVLEFAFRTNVPRLPSAFAQKLSTVRNRHSDLDGIVEDRTLTANNSRRWTEQSKELAALAQKVTLATAEPLRASATKAFSQLA